VLLLLLEHGLAKKSHALLPPLFPLVLHLFAQMREAGTECNHVVQAGVNGRMGE